MHAYDADRSPGGKDRRPPGPRGGDGSPRSTTSERPLDERMLVIADRERPDRPGRDHGRRGHRGDRCDPPGHPRVGHLPRPDVRNTARRLGLRSEASMRHEKGISMDLPRVAADRAAALIAEITGARVASGIVDNDPGAPPLRVIEVDAARTERLLGHPGGRRARAAEWLTPLGFEVADHGEGEVAGDRPAPPPGRHRGRGRGRGDGAGPRLRPDPGNDAEGRPSAQPARSVRRAARSPARAGGAGPRRGRHPRPHRSGRHRAAPGSTPTPRTSCGSRIRCRRSTPILRPVPYPSVFAALAENARQRRTNVAIFEVGKSYHYRPTSGDELRQAASPYRESWKLGIGLMGMATERYPGEPARAWDVADLKGIVDAVHEAMGAPVPTYRAEGPEERHGHLHPGRAARMTDATGRSYGSLGEAHPAVADAWDLPSRPMLAAIHLDPTWPVRAGAALEPGGRRARPPSRWTATWRSSWTRRRPVGELHPAGPPERRPAAGRGAPVRRVPRHSRSGRAASPTASRSASSPNRRPTSDPSPGPMDKISGALRHHLAAEIR